MLVFANISPHFKNKNFIKKILLFKIELFGKVLARVILYTIDSVTGKQELGV
jgi:hypothetical protein